MRFLRKYRKIIVCFLVANFLMQIIVPTAVYALTGGPQSPEFSSFEPVTTTDMVNPQTGDFTYNLPVINIPGPDGSGYGLSLSYHSGAGAEEEASWVGFGWTLNPGAINRSVRGVPDEFNGVDITYYNKTRPNWSASRSMELGLEIMSSDVSLNASRAMSFNNYTGLCETIGLGVGVKGYGQVGMSLNGYEKTFSFSVNPTFILDGLNKHAEKGKKGSALAAKVVKGIQMVKNLAGVITGPISKLTSLTSFSISNNGAEIPKKINSGGGGASSYTSSYGIWGYGEVERPLSGTTQFAISYNWSNAAHPNLTIPMGVEAGIKGNFNIQMTQFEAVKKVYGYNYTPTTLNNKDITKVETHPEYNPDINKVEDYYVEKNSPYNKRDVHIGIPFNNADSYVLTGEGLGGGFRAYRKQMGTYYPEHIENEMPIKETGIELGLGQTITVGFDFCGGRQKNKVESWDNKNLPKFNNNDVLYRFTNDLSGEIGYDNTSNILSASLENQIADVKGIKMFKPKMNEAALYPLASVGEGAIIPRSSYIKENLDGGFPRGFIITKEDGTIYSYTNTISSKEETSLSFGVGEMADGNSQIYGDYLMANSGITDEENPLSMSTCKVVTGEKQLRLYASSCLLESIESPDYYDVGNDGIDSKDFGNKTEFKYRTKTGYYNWRAPYSGLLYNANKISNNRDDMAFMQKGKKQVKYLQTVETKTHIAFFITNKTVSSTAFKAVDYPNIDLSKIPTGYLSGTQDPRLDGLSADDNASTGINLKGIAQLERLEKIVLFAKNRMDKPLKVVHFQYTNSLVKNLPNNEKGAWPSTPVNQIDYGKSGKLTLQKVWFEYEGISNARISPYEFFYEYFIDYPQKDVSAYNLYSNNGIANYYLYLSGTAQNPDYNPYSLDMWGNHQYDGKNRKLKRMPWVYQGKPTLIHLDKYNDDGSDFDPAAWQLKRIKLPSGGEIHVQYEQKEYKYVQDKPAHAMVSLKSNSQDAKDNSNYFYLNTDDLGLEKDTDGKVKLEELEKLKLLIENMYVGHPEKKMYFKFLYGLKEDYFPKLAGSNGVEQQNISEKYDAFSEYITGYAVVDKVVVNSGTHEIYVSLGETGANERDTPQDAAEYFIYQNMGGKMVSGKTGYEGADNDIFDDVLATPNIDSPTENPFSKDPILRKAVKKKAREVLRELTIDDVKYDNIVAGAVDFSLSYLKIPITKNKVGGGVRVKRLLMYDEGLETGEQVVYGNEYFYVNEDGTSSGVATNEPAAGREENALVEFMPRLQQSFMNKMVNGRDMEEAEGPLGESIMPAPSIGYGRVVIQNIHSDKTGIGFSVNEYYTAKDYPITVDFTDLKDNHKRDKLKLNLGLINYDKNLEWVAQGFKFVLNNMHGQVKRIANYGGKYNKANTANPTKDSYLTSSEEYTYFNPNENLDIISYNSTGAFVKAAYFPGREVDIAMESSSVISNTAEFSVEVDVGITLMIPPPIWLTAGIGPMNFSKSGIHAHKTSKIVNYPSIVKSIKRTKDGAVQITENVAFDKYTGQAVIIKEYNDYYNLKQGTVINTNATYITQLKAAWMYPSMGPKYLDENNMNQLIQTCGSVETYNDVSPIKESSTPDTYNLEFANVLDVNIQTFDNSWTYDKADVPLLYRPFETYVYRSPISQGNDILKTDPTDRNFKSGIIAGPINLLPTNPIWNGGTLTDNNWVKTNKITKYTPNGQAIEEQDALGIYSTAVYGYNSLMPVLVAHNAQNNTVYFYDFENSLDYSLLGSSIISTQAHSGKQSIQLSSTSTTIIDNVSALGFYNKTGIIRFWIKTPRDVNTLSNFNIDVNTTLYPITYIARTGEWQLCEAKIKNMGASSGTLTITLKYPPFISGENVYVDDLRLQPADATMVGYVYDPYSMRPVATFDDQNFGMYYEYNAEGKLVRKVIETERGKMTVQENQYNTKKTVRN